MSTHIVQLAEGNYAAGTKLYTAPPQREWQSLTDEEIKDALQVAGIDTWFSYRLAAKAVEAKLKEKNAKS